MNKRIVTILILMVGVVMAIVLNIESSKVQQVAIEEIETSGPIVLQEIPKTYTQYQADITFKENYFKGKYTIQYVHQEEQPIHQLLIKLYLKAYERDSTQNPYFVDSISRHDEEIETDGYIKVNDVKINRESCKTYEDFTNLWISLPKVTQKGQLLEIEMNIEGKIPNINNQIGAKGNKLWANGFLPQVGVFSSEEGWITTNTYCTGQYIYSEVADYVVSCTVSDERIPVGSGVLIEELELDDGQKRYVYQAKRVRDFGMYLGSKIEKHKLELMDGKNIFLYTDDTMDLEALQHTLQEIFSYYSKMFGTYPYERFVIIHNEQIKQPVVYPQLFIGDIKKILSRKSDFYELIGKQWIPNIIQHHPMSGGYINNGLNFYLAKRATTSFKSMEKMIKQMNYTYNLNSIEEKPYVTYQNYYKEEFIRPLNLFFELEKKLGEENWRKFLNEYYKRYAFKLPRTSDFETFMLEETNMSANKIFYEYENAEGRKTD